MALGKERDLERQAEEARNRLRSAVSELRVRTTPSYIMRQGRELGLAKGRELLGEGMDFAKQHGAGAALVGAGAILAFDLGKKSVGRMPSEADVAGGQIGPRPVVASDGSLSARVAKISDGAAILGEAMGAMALGSALGAAIPETMTERQLLGGIEAELKVSLKDFTGQHLLGIKHTAAQAFGIAGAAAWLLGILAAAADKLKPAPTKQ